MDLFLARRINLDKIYHNSQSYDHKVGKMDKLANLIIQIIRNFNLTKYLAILIENYFHFYYYYYYKKYCLIIIIINRCYQIILEHFSLNFNFNLNFKLVMIV